jgi:MFS family permease
VTKLLATKARNALWLQFFVSGVFLWPGCPRVPEIKTANELSDTQFGLELIASSIGPVLGAQLSGRAIHRLGSRPVLSVAQIVVPVGVAIMGLSVTPLVLAAGLFFMGFGYAALDVAGNAQAVAIETHLKKRYITSFHGMWSVGTLATTLLGGGLAFYISPRKNLLRVAGEGLVVFLVTSRYLLAPDLDNHSGEEDTKSSMPWFGKAAWPLWILGIGATGTFIAEGAAADWAALLLRDEMGVEIGYYASAFATFALAMILSRFLGDRWLERFGPYQLVRFLGLLVVGYGVS